MYLVNNSFEYSYPQQDRHEVSCVYLFSNLREKRKFTENPKQYLLFCNTVKYNHIIDRGLVTVVNRSGETKAIFNYEEVCRYLDATAINN